jgi:serine/threonine protein phosphatase PrpC
VDGNLALSRAFGDFQFKDQPKKSQEDQAVTSNPDVLVFDRTKNDEFIVLACDGIWDCLSN